MSSAIARLTLVIVMASMSLLPAMGAIPEPKPATWLPGPPIVEPVVSQPGTSAGADSRILLPLVVRNQQETFPWRGFNPPGFLDYNDEDYWVYQRSVCLRPVTVAWDKDAGMAQSHRDEVSAFYFDTFLRWCRLFGAFPYSSYTVVLQVESEFAGGEQGIGYETLASEYVGNYWQRVAHEVFHAWEGNFLMDAQEVLYDDGLWFREGITQYYGDRGAGLGQYQDLMQGHWRRYREQIRGTQYDIPLAEMPARAQATGDFQYRLNVYWKGALVAYMMDLRLREGDVTLNDYMVYMYNEYARRQQPFTTTQAREALSALSGRNWTSFFDNYIYGTTPLPLNGVFEYLPD